MKKITRFKNDTLTLLASHKELKTMKRLLYKHINQINSSLVDIEKHSFPIEEMIKAKQDVKRLWKQEKLEAYGLLAGGMAKI